jgi:hypothetical protein
MKTILLRTGSGIVKGSATLVSWSETTLRTTHNGDTRFKYQAVSTPMAFDTKRNHAAAAGG